MNYNDYMYDEDYIHDKECAEAEYEAEAEVERLNKEVKMETNIILQGDSLTQLKTLPDESIDCVMTSPPYWALRDYGVEGQLGLEPTFEEYINKLCDIFDEVKRVLKKTGICWVNLGDTYGGSKGGGPDSLEREKENKSWTDKSKKFVTRPPKANVPDKSLIMIPFRFAIEMVNRGWILRNNIIWHKRNCMPSSVKDRFTVDFEYLFFFTKSKKYFFEQVLQPTITKDNIIRDRDTTKLNNTPGRTKMGGLKKNDYDLKNKRTVWSINPKPYKEAHFAVYPEELCETPLKAGCPEFVCVKCGDPREKIIETDNPSKEYEDEMKEEAKEKGYTEHSSARLYTSLHAKGKNWKGKSEFKGLTDCGCNKEFIGGIVLDPFFGSGTTGIVALKQQKKFIGIELNNEYIEIANKRLKPYLEQTTL